MKIQVRNFLKIFAGYFYQENCGKTAKKSAIIELEQIVIPHQILCGMVLPIK